MSAFNGPSPSSTNLAPSSRGLDDDVGLLLTVEPPDVNDQGLMIVQPEFGAQPRVPALRPELADLDPERHCVDPANAQ